MGRSKILLIFIYQRQLLLALVLDQSLEVDRAGVCAGPEIREKKGPDLWKGTTLLIINFFSSFLFYQGSTYFALPGDGNC
jgi:hypothetical protein